jgi:hypothetical protein
MMLTAVVRQVLTLRAAALDHVEALRLTQGQIYHFIRSELNRKALTMFVMCILQIANSWYFYDVI